MNRPLADEKGIDLDVSAHDELPSVLVDRQKFHQVIDSLVANAVKWSPAKSKIEIRFLLRDDLVILSLQDEGSGVRAEESKTTVRPFQGGRRKVKTLGLAIVARIIKGHGGRLKVENQSTKGFRLMVTLPISTGSNGRILRLKAIAAGAALRNKPEGKLVTRLASRFQPNAQPSS
jgi:signal transduction histidine kinase